MADKVFTLAELAQYDGQDGRPAYFAYEGQVYDASSIPNWKENKNHGTLPARTSLTPSSTPPTGPESSKACQWLVPSVKVTKKTRQCAGSFFECEPTIGRP
ncbi:hypothetical protein [Limosilactobacillus fermentum]|uniref:hypothetical protein n=1 Tax=Limosilactobacillus fermentum TaxID=1613 RepID=UPI0039BDCBE2